MHINMTDVIMYTNNINMHLFYHLLIVDVINKNNVTSSSCEEIVLALSPKNKNELVTSSLIMLLLTVYGVVAVRHLA